VRLIILHRNRRAIIVHERFTVALVIAAHLLSKIAAFVAFALCIAEDAPPEFRTSGAL
jgi:hypothetical protein